MKKILLVEDDTAIIDVYKTALEAGGFEVEIITMGKDVIEKVDKLEKGEAEKPDLVLLDIVLPDMNGMEILKEMRKRDVSKDLPVLVLTNYSDKKLEEEGKALNAKRFVLKAACSPNNLVKIVGEELGE